MIKKALLVGINAYPSAPLRGCLNDVAQMYDILKGTYGFAAENIKVLRDADATYHGIEAGLAWLAEAGPGSDHSDVRVFHYSGHGTQVPDENHEEADGSDEAICPVDYESKGFIIDDRLAALYAKVPKGSNLTILMDSCHSGGGQRPLSGDIVYRNLPIPPETWEKIETARQEFEAKQEAWILSRLRNARNLSDEELEAKVRELAKSFRAARSRFGDVTNRESNVLLAGCKNVQTSADAYIAGNYHGAFTYYLVEAVKSLGPTATAKAIAAATGTALKSNRYSQIPQLEGTVAHKELPLFASFG